MKYIQFIRNRTKKIEFPEHSYVARIPAISTKEGLYGELMDHLNFPYFGKNWDSLIDLYRDFCWIDNDNVVIIHEGIAELPMKDLILYVETALICIDHWSGQSISQRERKSLHRMEWEAPLHHVWFFFPEKEESKIMHIIRESVKTNLSELHFNMEDE